MEPQGNDGKADSGAKGKYHGRQKINKNDSSGLEQADDDKGNSVTKEVFHEIIEVNHDDPNDYNMIESSCIEHVQLDELDVGREEEINMHEHDDEQSNDKICVRKRIRNPEKWK